MSANVIRTRITAGSCSEHGNNTLGYGIIIIRTVEKRLPGFLLLSMTGAKVTNLQVSLF